MQYYFQQTPGQHPPDSTDKIYSSHNSGQATASFEYNTFCVVQTNAANWLPQKYDQQTSVLPFPRFADLLPAPVPKPSTSIPYPILQRNDTTEKEKHFVYLSPQSFRTPLPTTVLSHAPATTALKGIPKIMFFHPGPSPGINLQNHKDVQYIPPLRQEQHQCIHRQVNATSIRLQELRLSHAGVPTTSACPHDYFQSTLRHFQFPAGHPQLHSAQK